MGAALGRTEGGTVGFIVGTGVGEPAAIGVTGALVGATKLLPRATNRALKAVKLRDPRPVTGSHPAVVVKPCGQHTLALHLLLPEVISLVKLLVFARAYRAGLRKPSELFPAAIRAVRRKSSRKD